MATYTCKNVDGYGNVTYVDYEIAEPEPEEDNEAEIEDLLEALRKLGVEV